MDTRPSDPSGRVSVNVSHWLPPSRQANRLMAGCLPPVGLVPPRSSIGGVVFAGNGLPMGGHVVRSR
jgi:hypothetical protein